MAAPTDVRVEATSISTTVIRWVYSGSAGVSIYRSTDGVSYASIVDGLATTTTEYTDTGLATGTKYWYKLTDDAGATFSSVVTTWTHACVSDASGVDTMALPRLHPGGGDPASEFNEMAETLETVLGDRVLKPTQCLVCSSDGRLVIDCSEGCHEFYVEVTEDINSISLNWCDGGEGNIEFVIPPNTTRKVCGWPGGFGFGGDECFRAPISGGSAGRSMSVGISGSGAKADVGSTKSRSGYTSGVGRGGGSSGSTCTCVPAGNGALTIKSCTANNSMSCASTKKLTLIACGGRGPYTWSKTGTVVLSRTAGSSVAVTPATNSGSGEAGTAYRECHYGNNGAFGCNTTNVIINDILDYGCNDQLLQCQQIDAVGCSAPSAQILPCITGLGTCSIPQCDGCVSHQDYKQSAVDRRTAPMIAAGCNPCGVSTIGATVSVTDSVGTVVTIALRN